MNELIKSFSYNAGKLWEVLDAEGPQVQSKLQKMTKMREDEFFGAVGWLARENKISRDKRTYKIGNTNLTTKIGHDAGKIWDVLGRNQDIDVSAIARITNIEKRDCYSALGWLAREGKITAKTLIKKK